MDDKLVELLLSDPFISPHPLIHIQTPNSLVHITYSHFALPSEAWSYFGNLKLDFVILDMEKPEQGTILSIIGKYDGYHINVEGKGFFNTKRGFSKEEISAGHYFALFWPEIKEPFLKAYKQSLH